MATTSFTNTIEFSEPFDLIIGSEYLSVKEPARLESVREHYAHEEANLTEPVFISPRPIHEVISLYLSGKLFAVAEHHGAEAEVWSISKIIKGGSECHVLCLNPVYTQIVK